jgi:hypothetical protein
LPSFCETLSGTLTVTTTMIMTAPISAKWKPRMPSYSFSSRPDPCGFIAVD